MTKQSKSQYVVAVDIGGTTVKLGLYRAAAGRLTAPQLLDKQVIPTRTAHAGREILPDTAQAICALTAAHDITVADLAGIGIGVPGPVITAEDGSQIVNRCVNLGWGVTDVTAAMRSLTGVTDICVLNDANAAALGEFYYGQGRQAAASEETADRAADNTKPMDAAMPADSAVLPRSAVMMTLGTGVGGGVITEGRILEGTFGAAGEIGHMPIQPSHPLRDQLLTAQRAQGVAEDDLVLLQGDLEYYCSATGIARTAQAALTYLDAPSSLGTLPRDQVTARDVFDAAKASDPLAREVVSCFFDTLGQGLACIASVTDPSLFIIGGGVSHAGAYLLEGVQAAYRRQVFHASRETDFRLASLGNDAGLIGTLVPLLHTAG